MSARDWFLVTALAYLAVLVLAWLMLPERGVPLHFGLDGSPDRWGTRAGAVLTFAVVGAGTAALFTGMARLVRSGRLPFSLVNLPHRDYWGAPEHVPAARGMLGADLHAFGALTLALLGAVVLTSVAAARTGGSFLPWGAIAVGAYLVATAVWLVHMQTSRYRPPEEA